MNQLERREHILQALELNGQVLVKEMSSSLGTSEVTLRTDLKALEKEGKLKRFFGGAQSIKHLPLLQVDTEVQIDKRYEINSESKQRIASAAAKLVSPADTIILDSGSTTHLIAERLAETGGNTVITNNLAACTALMEAEDTVLVVIGGTYRNKTKSLHGFRAEQCLDGVQADVLFVGADGLDPEKGITTFNEGYTITGIMANCVKKVVAVVDSTKLGRIGFNKVLDISRIDTLIIDTGITEEQKAKFEIGGIEVIVV
ncbi:DeoR/GlpR family DNA-binding transcription regulator [Vibrio owensii]|uniref:Galactitol utilization operon repressor n=1 Tax=Vibrio owensii CAIM 1854 = LMG 25443 TaxID=1229493 RepID=A0A0C1WDA0_9VIBR|nr:DeoR/GlpR family DNA-binding transcription regulator [Vibrio owensii]KIF54332.1 galactitol utilization operon repressor [Vibrio owensii CAIM 1854 = LMG 25443]MDA0383567.1 DeoR/GlpR family DNA-binding transcription regulator [Vibrio owensii]